MFHILLLISAIIGAILAVLSQAQNLLLLFGGLGLVIASFLVFLINKYARILFFPFIILLGVVLFMFNALDFRPNNVSIDFINQGIYSPSYFVGDREYPLGVPIPPLNDELLENFRIQFQQPPLLSPDDFILSDYQAADNLMDAIWYWDGEPRWLQISNADYLHIYDPLINVYYPDEVTALLLVDRLEFSLIDFSSEPAPIITRLNINELYYQTQPTDLHFNSPVKQVIIKSAVNLSQPNYKVWVNGNLLTWESSNEGWHVFTVDDPIYEVEKLEIIEKAQPVPNTIRVLQPTFSAIYVLEEAPRPIVIENIALKKYFARVNLTLPVFDWNAQAIQTDFTAVNSTLTQENGFAHLKSGGIQFALNLNQPSEPIIGQELASLAPIRMWGNVIITISMLLAFILLALFLNRYLDSIKEWIKNWFEWIKKVFANRPVTLNFHKLTPFKLFFFSFQILSWVLFLTIPINPYLLLTLLILSGCSAYYVIKDLEFK